MIDIQGEVFKRLRDDATLGALLAEYDADPALFEEGKTPFAFEFGVLPMALVTPSSHQADDDTYSADFRIEQVQVRLYHRGEGSSLPLQTAAERVRRLLKNWSASVSGGSVVNASVLGPSPAPTDDPSLDGRIVLITLLVKET